AYEDRDDERHGERLDAAHEGLRQDVLAPLPELVGGYVAQGAAHEPESVAGAVDALYEDVAGRLRDVQVHEPPQLISGKKNRRNPARADSSFVVPPERNCMRPKRSERRE